jgi:hypothetical protein
MSQRARRPEHVSPARRMTNETDDIPTLQLRVLERIQAELVRLNEKRDETNKRLDATNERLDTGLASVRREMHDGFTRLRTELIELRKDVDDGLTGVKDEMHVGFTALRQQNDRRFLDHERRLRAIEKQLARRH